MEKIFRENFTKQAGKSNVEIFVKIENAAMFVCL
jgi:hypothetical protein